MENREKWTLTILRIGSDEFSSDLEDARFRFGRHKMELSDPEQDATRLPSGLIELVRETNLEEQALETGITVEMSTLDRPAPDWKEFWSTATIFPDVPWRSPRTLYTSSSGSSVEVIQILSCSSLPKRMPGRIFIRAAPLQESVVFWAMENEVFNSQQGRQMKLDHWITILESDSISESFVPQKEQIPLPGPSNRPSEFLDRRR